MKTLCIFESTAQFIPQITAWHLADLGEYLGKQKLYEQQAPQKLKVLKEHAIIESAVSSNRIEGVNVDPARVKGSGIWQGIYRCGYREKMSRRKP